MNVDDKHGRFRVPRCPQARHPPLKHMPHCLIGVLCRPVKVGWLFEHVLVKEGDYCVRPRCFKVFRGSPCFAIFPSRTYALTRFHDAPVVRADRLQDAFHPPSLFRVKGYFTRTSSQRTNLNLKSEVSVCLRRLGVPPRPPKRVSSWRAFCGRITVIRHGTLENP